MLTGRYTNIRRFSVHDGPGIRTTLFLKGCSLACQWCHNPEAISNRPELAIHYSRCVGCGECTLRCPNHQINEKHDFWREQCVACGKCVEVCLHGALELMGREITVSAAVQILLEDKSFYDPTGGVTVSGGEPLLQADFCLALFKALKTEGVHIAVDTCGNVPWESFVKVLPYVDLFLYDFKAADADKHRRFTGCDNQLILANLRRLDEQGGITEVRMIQIPDWNMSPADLTEAADFLTQLKHLTAVRLLAYHSLARSKYVAVGRPDTMPQVYSPSADALEENAAILRQRGLRVINSLKD